MNRRLCRGLLELHQRDPPREAGPPGVDTGWAVLPSRVGTDAAGPGADRGVSFLPVTHDNQIPFLFSSL